MKDIYLKIIEIFENNRDRFLQKGLLPVETIDLYDGQPDEPNNFEFTCPAVFVDYAIEWERGGNRMKKGIVNIELHVLTHPAAGTENFNPRLTEGLRKLDYYNLIAELMEQVATENSPNLALISEQPAITDYFCYHILKFNTTVWRGKNPVYTKINDVKPEIRTIK